MTDWKSFREFFKTSFSHVFFTLFKLFKKPFALSLFDRSGSSEFLSFSSKFFSRFLSSCANKTFLPFPFHFIHIFHAFFIHFKGNFWTYRNLGFLIFEMVFFQTDHWVFVLRCCKHVSHALIWLIWWIENNLKFQGL